ncbi:DDT domain-containing protein DDB_G0282237 isoform X1 [Ricinus communis]|uniref:DDT domain-containing protein DDB_G0282237 isoform X1 n=2 Tax=Ricinus communis TaxID=3988 RepID=UPI000772683E|nr:DDT domain-containing protein DDB_G0282237 isoform X1 [Ricinus communis]XP_015571068.1 DDT domain-containing protein DDB_G0282237 isoform X1 [Ricinus communis]|eukprot:XP_015571067.1 DDT domain-containing protein DDB_G0282237 isoform X1 [Ricinus communis]
MPLLKKKPFTLLEPPQDLKPNELVYQVRFTKEIFRDYQAYLNRLNLYRQRIWSCKISGKPYLTFEEALVSEKHASEKVQDIPKELVAPALHIIQYSMLSLKDLADTIAKKLQEHLFVGAALHGRKGDDLCPCKVLKIMEGTAETAYEVAWLDKSNKIAETSVVIREDLTWKKFPFSRRILKSLIRESTYRSVPWALHINLAQKHGISCDPPLEIEGKVSIKDGLVVCYKKRKEGVENESGKHKKKKVGGEEVEATDMENGGKRGEPIKYPIDDLLVQPGEDDPVFTTRPSPSRDFCIQMDCVGDLLMVWDFCSSFGRMLHLSPFSLEDFEKAICHKDSNLMLLVETHSALLQLLMKNNGQYFLAVKKRNRKLKITFMKWTEYLCDFVEMINISDLSAHATVIRRGHYGLLDVEAKLGILRELVNHVLETDLVREKLDEHIEQRQLLGATRRGEALEEGRKRREEKEKLKAETVDTLMNGYSIESVGNNPNVSANGKHLRENGDLAMKWKGEVISSPENHASDKSETSNSDTASKKTKQHSDVEVLGENLKNLSSKTGFKQLKSERKEAVEKRSKEERNEYYEREMEKRVLRTNSLGKDRDYNRYWWFRRDGRIFIESSDSKLWGYYSGKEELDALMGSLNCKGVREKALQIQLQKLYSRICFELEKRAKDLAHKITMEEAVLRRSTRVRALPRENPANSFLRYVNKWKED